MYTSIHSSRSNSRNMGLRIQNYNNILTYVGKLCVVEIRISSWSCVLALLGVSQLKTHATDHLGDEQLSLFVPIGWCFENCLSQSFCDDSTESGRHLTKRNILSTSIDMKLTNRYEDLPRRQKHRTDENSFQSTPIWLHQLLATWWLRNKFYDVDPWAHKVEDRTTWWIMFRFSLMSRERHFPFRKTKICSRVHGTCWSTDPVRDRLALPCVGRRSRVNWDSSAIVTEVRWAALPVSSRKSRRAASRRRPCDRFWM